MAESSTNPSWQGTNHQVPEVQHRWASGAQEMPNGKSIARNGSPRLKIAALFGLAIVATIVLVYSVSYYPKKTPLITICLSDYSWPLAPNAGVDEDLRGLQLLDDFNVDLLDISERWKNKQSGMNRLNEALEGISAGGYQQGPVLIYINGHGVVDKNGEPCLILPGYDPLATDQWLGMRQFVRSIHAKVDPSTEIVLIVDCVKARRDWKLGVLVNTWQPRMKSLVEELSLDNLKVISAVGDYQVNEYSTELQGTVFGHFLRLGLAGFSDVAQSEGSSNDGNLGEGNGDGQVTVTELMAYLRAEVSNWTAQNRGDLQLPELMSTSNHSTSMVTALNRESMDAIRNTRQLESPQSISLDRLGLLWGKLDRCRNDDLMRNQPQLMHFFQNQLLHLEQLCNAGKAYSTNANRLYQKLDTELDRELEKFGGLKSLLAESIDLRMTGTLRANELLGILTPTDTERLRQEFLQVSADLQSSPFLVGERTGQPQAQEAFVGSWLNRLNISGVWPNQSFSERYARLHLDSENAGLPDDIRIHPWAKEELEQADVSRRKAFDLLFTGEAGAEEALEAGEKQFEKILEESSSVCNRLRSHFQQLDSATSQFLPLALWHTRWYPPVAEREVNQEVLDPRLRLSDLAAHLHDQSIDLAQPSLARDNLGLNESNREIGKLLSGLQSEFEDNYQKLLDTSTVDGTLVFQIKECLKLPLIPSAKRKELWEKLRVAELELASKEDKEAFNNLVALQDSWQDRMAGEAETQLDLTSNPLVEFFGISKGEIVKEETLSGLDNLAADIRTRIQRLPKRDFLILLAEGKIASLKLTGIQKTRAMLSHAAFVQRQSLALVDHDKLDSNVVGELVRFELQQALLWQAKRSQLDFYGRRPDETQSRLDGNYAFEAIAKGFYRTASLLYPDSPSLEQTTSQGMEELEQLKKGAKRAVEMSVESELQIDEEDDSQLEIRLSSLSNRLTNSGQLDGCIAFRLQPTGETSWGPGFKMNFPLDPNGVFKTWKVSSESNSRLVAFFRGHVFQTSVLLKSLAGHQVTVLPEPDKESQVTLVGDRSGPAAVVFILDCSQSMAQSIKTELIGNEQVPRLEFAKGVLSTMLRELALRRDTRVGVRFFGHRSGWSTDLPSVRMRQESYQGKFPDLLVPENDVELALPVGRFTLVEADKIKKQMESIKPWGQSPLNLALIQAVNDFEFEPEGTQKSIVVITDGKNYQFSPNRDTTGSPRLTTLSDVTSQVEAKKVPIFILGFGIPEDEREEAEESFYSIAEKSGGKYFAVSSGKELLQTMRNQLKLGTYRVYSTQQGPADSRRNQLHRLYDPVEITQPGDYRIVADSADLSFEVEGGEALQFRLEEGPVITGIPYDRNQLEMVQLGNQSKAGRIQFRAHRPNRNGETVDFVFSFQFAKQAFTPRPKEIWIQIKPVYEKNELPKQNNSSFVFYDAAFSSKTPVPVMNCRVASWPTSSQTAEVRVFCKFDQTLPREVVPLKSWIGSGETQELRTVENIPGLKYRVETNAGRNGSSLIRIVEEHESGSEGIYSTKVDLFTSPKFKPQKIFRQFDAQKNVGVHNFYFDPRTFEAVLDSPDSSLRFTTKKQLERDAWLQREPMNIRIFPELELLPLDAVDGAR